MKKEVDEIFKKNKQPSIWDFSEQDIFPWVLVEGEKPEIEDFWLEVEQCQAKSHLNWLKSKEKEMGMEVKKEQVENPVILDIIHQQLRKLMFALESLEQDIEEHWKERARKEKIPFRQECVRRCWKKLNDYEKQLALAAIRFEFRYERFPHLQRSKMLEEQIVPFLNGIEAAL